MKLSEAVKPVSYLQDYAPEIIHQLAEGQQTLVITEDGEAKAVLVDIHIYRCSDNSWHKARGGGGLSKAYCSYVVEGRD
ncbi:MAG: type II toxin-antitoxin system Phd/YefM family antitoxin [bacterium]|nr:type II toxin-antitoxin system Phd/YefM family antitoxin [bacterium]